MKTAKSKSRRYGLSAVIAVVALVVAGVLMLRPVMEVSASIDPGLDSGNAVVDRTTVPGQTILIYNTAGNSSTFKAPAGVSSVRVLVVGGGGGGGIFGGGGGAGGVIANPNVAVTPGVSTAVTVGGGGAGSTSRSVRAANGSNSVFGSLNAIGGGGGGSDNGGTYVSSVSDGANGGSGGGSGDRSPSVGGTGTAGQGNNGGNATAITHGAGGGGAGGPGQSSGTEVNLTDGGDGGLSINNDITGASVAYAGGGGAQYGGIGGGAGAGNGATANFSPGTSAAANTGSGGGGGANGNGGNGGSGIVIVRFATQNALDPAGVPGAVMWYRADSSGNTVALWNDTSGLGYNMTQATVTKQPSLNPNGLNFNPAYDFDGTDDVFNMPSGVGGSNSMTSFYAATSTDPAGGDRYFNEFGDDRPSITIYNGKPRLYVRDTSSVDDIYASEASLKPHVFSFVSPNGGGDKVIGVDNKEQTKSITGTYVTSAGATGNTFGSKNVSSGVPWKGPIGEAIFFNRVLTPAERLKINSYLGIKYAITLDQGTSGTAYVNSASATIWPADATYKNAITGIGRDDASTLNQKQSKNLDDIVTIGHGDILASNQANTNNFSADHTFMLWGHNGAQTDQSTTVTGTYLRMNRIWKAVTTNTVGPVKIRVPASEVKTGNNGILYISNTPTFDGSAQQVTMTLNGGNYEATTTLPAGTRYFSFGSFTGSDIEMVSKSATDTNNNPIAAYTPGQSMEYVLSVRNNGPDKSGLITVTDNLPPNLVPSSASGVGWNCNPPAGQTVTCTMPELASGATASNIIIEVDIASSVTGQKINNAQANVANDPNPANNSKSLTLDAAPEADLSIIKDSSVTNPTPGTNFDYTFTIENNGPSDTPSYTITDTLPIPELSYVSASPNICGGSSGQTITCTDPAGITSGGVPKTVTVTVHLDGSFAGTNITNTAHVAVPSGVLDPISGNNESTNNTNADPKTALSINKTHSGNFIAGENGTFTITVTNAASHSDAPIGSVTVTDTLDEDFSYVSAGGTGWNCPAPTDSTVSCTNTAPIVSGTPFGDISLEVAVDTNAKGATTNTAELSSTIPDEGTPHSHTDNITIESNVDMGIVKAPVNPPFIPGQQEQYTFTVTNAGPSSDSPSYTFTDTLNANLTFVSATGAATCAPDGVNPQLITCTGGGIAANGPAQVTTMTVTVSASATGTIPNSATVAGAAGTTETNPGNNTSNINTNVEPVANLSIVKEHTGDITAGDNEAYTLTTSNGGPAAVTSYTVTDTLDPNLIFQSSVPNGACMPSGTSPEGGQILTCTGAAIPNAGQDIITVNVTVDATATPGSPITNTATVEPPTGTTDLDTTNNTAILTKNVQVSADVAVTKMHTGNFKVGTQGTFTIEVSNLNGPSDADTVTVTDVLPAGFTYVSATSSTGADCSNVDQTVTCTIGPSLAKAETVTITLTVSVDADVTVASLDNTVSAAAATTPDPDLSNNSHTDTVNIDEATADLTATKNAQGALTAGLPVTYRFEVSNPTGPDAAPLVTITDPLPSYLTYQSFSSVSGSWSCTGGTTVTCTNNGVIAVGDSAIVDVTMLVAQDAPTPAENTATVGLNGQDPTPPSPSSSDPVSYSADLAAKLTHQAETYHSGDTVIYTYTVDNFGPSAAEDVVLTDTLPDGLTFESLVATAQPDNSLLAKVGNFFMPTASAAPNTPFSCLTSGQNITCSANLLFVGTYIITMKAKISPTFTGNLTSMVQIASATFDPNSANNSSTDTVVDVTRRPGGLAATGQNIFVWIAVLIGIFAAAVLLLRAHRKRNQTLGV